MGIQQMLMAVGGDINLLLASSATDYNVFMAAGSPTGPVYVTLTVAPGVTVGGVSGTVIKADQLPAGSTLKIINNGTFIGRSGVGGAQTGSSGSGYPGNGNPGAPGGDAIAISCDLVIDNTNGYIYAGAGGGGSGGWCVVPGAAGGYGRGYVYSSLVQGQCQGTIGLCDNYYRWCPGVGGVPPQPSGVFGGNGGNNPTPNPPGDASYADGIYGAGAGGNGGDYASPGGTGGNSAGGGYGTGYGGVGGAAGYAIRLNGKTVTWLGGNNSTQVKGVVA